MQFQRARQALGAFLVGAATIVATPLITWSQAPSTESPTRSTAELAKDALQKQIARLIEQLGDENFQTRRAAEFALVRIGLPAFEQLRQAINHPNVQIEVAATGPG